MHVTSASLVSLQSPAQTPQPTGLTGPYGLDVSLTPYYSVLGVLQAMRTIAIFRCLRDSMGEALAMNHVLSRGRVCLLIHTMHMLISWLQSPFPL